MANTKDFNFSLLCAINKCWESGIVPIFADFYPRLNFLIKNTKFGTQHPCVLQKLRFSAVFF